jgi:hypothetical protein
MTAPTSKLSHVSAWKNRKREKKFFGKGAEIAAFIRKSA